jgi:N-acetylmuramoyl-L-alanine amidase
MRPRLVAVDGAPVADGHPPAPVDPALDTLARTIYGEARGEGVRGMEAVAAVVLNRAALAASGRIRWWGRTVEDVCRHPWQFSCWNPGDPNRAVLLAVQAGDPVFDIALRVARRALAGALQDPTDGATHYHARSVFPSWADGRSPSAVIGNHVFYNDID